MPILAASTATATAANALDVDAKSFCFAAFFALRI